MSPGPALPRPVPGAADTGRGRSQSPVKPAPGSPKPSPSPGTYGRSVPAPVTNGTAPARGRSQSPVRGTSPRAQDPSTPTKYEDDAKVEAWQMEVDSLEQKQMQIQADQMTLLFSQIHILTRELGDLQKQFVVFGTDVTQKLEEMQGNLETSQQEAHAALRLELAEHGNNAAEMKAAWEEAHGALSASMDEGLANIAADHAKALEDHKAEQAQSLADHATANGGSLADLEALHNQRYEEHTASLQAGLSDVHSTLQNELAELRSGHEVNLRAVVTDITAQVDKLTMDVQQMATDLSAAQEEAHSALRLELAEHGNNADEMKAAWAEAHDALAKSCDENLANLADQHAKALEDHAASNAAALADHASTHGGSLADMETLHNQRYEEHQATLQAGLEDVHGTLQKELSELRSGHAVNLQAVVTDVTAQVDKLTLDVEQMAKDMTAAQEEAHSALRLELAAHGNNADEMAAAWKEAQGALSKAMDDGLSELAGNHAKALEDHKAEQAAALAAHADTHGANLDGLTSNLSDMEALHNQRYEQHTADLQAGLSDVHSTLQNELAELRSGHEVNLRSVVTDVTAQVDKLTQDVQTMATDLAAAQEEAHSALRLELAEHGNNAAEMKAAWEEAHGALAKSMDENLSQLAEEHAKALEQSMADTQKALDEHASSLEGNSGSLADMENMHNMRYEEHQASLQAGLEDVHGTLQKELAELRSGHAVNLQAVVTDITQQVDKLTLDVEQMSKDMTAAQEEAHSALRLELAEHGGNVQEMKAAWEEAHKALAASMDDGLSQLAEDHAKALEEHKASNAAALANHADTHGGSLTELETLHNSRYEEHTQVLEAGLEDVHGKLQAELAELKSGHAVNLQAVVTDITQQLDKLTLDVEAMETDLKAAQEEAHSALRLELAEHGSDAKEMKAAWEEAHDALNKSMDTALGDLAQQHADTQDKSSASHKARMDEMEAQIAAQFERLHSSHDSLTDMHDSHRLEHAAALEKGMEAVLENTHGRLQAELQDLRSGHASNLKQVLEDVTLQVDTLTLAMENAQVLRKANSEKLEQIFAQMANAFGGISFSAKKTGKDKADKKDKENGAATPKAKPAAAKAAAAAPAPTVTSRFGAAKK